MVKKKMPKDLYVVWDGMPDDTFLLAAEIIDDFAAVGKKQTVGVYKLVAVKEVTAKTTVSQRKVRGRVATA